MSMNYFIFSDIESEDSNDEKIRNLSRFPHGLSFLFEQVGGYGDRAEVSQVSKLLNIDLDLFQNVDFPENSNNSKTWQTIDSIINKLEEFGQCIKKDPQYFERVSHEGKVDPPDNGYLSKNLISQDIETLTSNLKALKEIGANKIRLFYM